MGRFFLVILQWVVFVGKTHLVVSALFLGPHPVFTFSPQSSPAASPFLARGEQDQKLLVEIETETLHMQLSTLKLILFISS